MGSVSALVLSCHQRQNPPSRICLYFPSPSYGTNWIHWSEMRYLVGTRLLHISSWSDDKLQTDCFQYIAACFSDLQLSHFPVHLTNPVHLPEAWSEMFPTELHDITPHQILRWKTQHFLHFQQTDALPADPGTPCNGILYPDISYKIPQCSPASPYGWFHMPTKDPLLCAVVVLYAVYPSSPDNNLRYPYPHILKNVFRFLWAACRIYYV